MPQTETRVVNLRAEKYDIYIGRSRHGQAPSKWGNPFQLEEKITTEQVKYLGEQNVPAHILRGEPIARAEAVDLYTSLLEAKIRNRSLSPKDFIEIHGKTLGCFCKPSDCHGDVIALFVAWFVQNPNATEGPPRAAHDKPRNTRMF